MQGTELVLVFGVLAGAYELVGGFVADGVEVVGHGSHRLNGVCQTSRPSQVR